jgi:hypothetical protein
MLGAVDRPHQVGEQYGEPGAPARAAGLDGADRAVEHLRCLGHGVALHVHEHERRALLLGEGAERVEHHAPALGPLGEVGGVLGGVRGRVRRAAVAVLLQVVGERLRPAHLRGPDPVQAGVHDDPVQPGGDRGLPAERPGAAVRRHHAVLEAVRRVLGIAHGAQCHRPEPVAVPGEQHPERLVVAGDVGGEQLGVGADVRPHRVRHRSPPPPRPNPGTSRPRAGAKSTRPPRIARSPGAPTQPRAPRSPRSRMPPGSGRRRRWADPR